MEGAEVGAGGDTEGLTRSHKERCRREGAEGRAPNGGRRREGVEGRAPKVAEGRTINTRSHKGGCRREGAEGRAPNGRRRR